MTISSRDKDGWKSRKPSRKSSRPSSPKSNSRRKCTRNDRIHLRSLLVEACKLLEQFYPELMPRRLRVWWTAQKLTKHRAEENDSRVIARLMDEMRELAESED